MPTSIDTFKKVYIELDVSSSPQQYSLTNNISYTNSCFLNFNLLTNSQSQVVDISVIQKTSVSGTIENTQIFTLNNSNNLLSRNINLFTPYTLIDISYNSIANSILSGFIEKMIMGDTLVDLSGQPIVYQNEIDISGQRVVTDISGQRVDISGQTILSRLYDGSGNNITSTSNALDINIKNQTINRSGTFNNIINNAALNTNSYSTALDVTGFNKAVLSYNDGQNLSDSILIFASLDNTNWFYYGAVIPVYYSILTRRYAATKLNLSQVRYIRIYNSSSTNITAANCTIVSS